MRMVISGYNFTNFVIKFGKKENLEKLKSGSVYMKDYWYYKNLEDGGMGDKLEGCEFSNQDVTIKVDDGGKDIVAPGFVYYEPNVENKVPIFCATWVDEKNAVLKKVELCGQHQITGRTIYFGCFSVKIDIDKIVKDFDCDYGLIFQYEEFKDKFERYCIEKKLNRDQGLVNYYDYKDRTNPWLKNKVNGFDRFYRKRKEFEHQNEVRWVIDKVLVGTDNYTFNIEKLETACLLPIEKFRDLEVKAYCYKE